MSQSANTDTSSTKKLRPYRKGNPLSVTERQQALIARRRDTHKEIRVFVQDSLKSQLQKLCKEEKMTQAELIAFLIDNASSILSKQSVKE